MNKLCRQVSIESPGPIVKDCVFSFDVPVPDVPPKGGRIMVVCAGACYRLRRTPSLSSLSSTSSEMSQEMSYPPQSPAYLGGVRDGALFPGYEVAGIVESVGEEVEDNPDNLAVGDRVVLYPYEGVPHGYAEFITVPDLRYLVKLPDCVPLSVAAMLPTGAVLAMNTVESAHQYVQDIIRERGPTGKCKILIVGTGGLALWTMRIAAHQYSSSKDQVSITVASLKDEGFLMAKEYKKVTIVQWNEDVYEKLLIERTKDACEGPVDIVIDFGTTSRSLHRSLQCLNDGGVVFINSEVAEKLMPKFSRKADERHQKLKAVKLGSIAQLKHLVQLVADGEIEPPPHSIFPAEEAGEVVKKLSQSEIKGRAILRFHSIE